MNSGIGALRHKIARCAGLVNANRVGAWRHKIALLAGLVASALRVNKRRAALSCTSISMRSLIRNGNGLETEVRFCQ